ncbi:MAG TPA: thioredoxin domain-containing protein [Vicinamibacterales bacterium]|nr:thioredoxin domain-containing protein [Vicinamibacterales bacterium]
MPVRHSLFFLAAAGLIGAIACGTNAQQSKQAKQPVPSDVVAKVGASTITLDEVDARALQEPATSFGSAKLVQALYMARRATIEEIVANRLLDEEAKARGIDRPTLVEREIAAKAPAPSESDIAAWYQANPARVNGASLDQVRVPIRNLLIEQRMDLARASFVEQLKTRTTIEILLDPPRVEITDGGRPPRGAASAPIEIIEFSDFQCPFCQRANPTVDQVLKTYGDRVKFVYRHYPLPNHPNARTSAEAAACAQVQGKFWEYHDQLFANPAKLTDPDLKAHAAAIGLDTAKFNTCFDNRQQKPGVDKDVADGEAVGVTGTPAFFINGRSLEGAQPFESFKRVIDEELARK